MARGRVREGRCDRVENGDESHFEIRLTAKDRGLTLPERTAMRRSI